MNTKTNNFGAQKYDVVFHDAVVRNKTWYRVQGILFIVAGVLALIVPTAAVIGVEIFLAALLLVSGGYQSYQGAVDRAGWLFVSGLLSLILGVALVLMPVAGAIALATLIAAFLLVEGVVEIFLAFQFRANSRWKWLLTSGVLSIILGILLLLGWPMQTLILAGILLGINFIVYGASIVAITYGEFA